MGKLQFYSITINYLFNMEGFKTRTESAEILIEKAAEATEGPLFTSLLSVVSMSNFQSSIMKVVSSPVKFVGRKCEKLGEYRYMYGGKSKNVNQGTPIGLPPLYEVDSVDSP